jgi:hypothetical protein
MLFTSLGGLLKRPLSGKILFEESNYAVKSIIIIVYCKDLIFLIFVFHYELFVIVLSRGMKEIIKKIRRLLNVIVYLLYRTKTKPHTIYGPTCTL